MKNKSKSFFECNNSIFAKTRDISRKIDMLLLNTANKLDITTLQLKMVIALGTSERQMTMGDLGKEVGVTGGNISNICKKLERSGFVRRVRSVEDERVVYVELTQKGNDAIKVVEKYFDNIKKDLPKEINELHLDDILQTLTKLDKLLDKYMTRSGI